MASQQQPTLEPLLAELNKNVFFREFSFSTTNFKSDVGGELELADHIISFDDYLMIFQAKQRGPIQNATEDGERKWFSKTVLGDATRQVRDTLKYLSTQPKILVSNQRGHQFDLSQIAPGLVTKLVVYIPHVDLPDDCRGVKWHVSKTAGPIHVVSWPDYLEICQTLITPVEVGQYFQFREEILSSRGGTGLPSERALVGQFLSGDFDAEPGERYVEYFNALVNNTDDFDISFLLHGIADRIESQEGSRSDVDYYAILAEFARLNRSALYQVRKRIRLSLEAIRNGQPRSPMRIIVRGCGFVFVPVASDELENLSELLQVVTLAAKYEQKLDKQVGVGFAKDGNHILIYWCLDRSEWQEDPEIDALLVSDNPFLPLRSVLAERYPFTGA